VVANVTAGSDELLAALQDRAQRGPVTFTLLVPSVDPTRTAYAAAESRLDAALERMREAELTVDGRVADPDPVVAVGEEFDPRRYDEIIVSTLPSGASKWLQIDLPHRIERVTGAPVRHVVSQPPRSEPVEPAPEHERRGVLAPFTVLTWGRAGRAGRRG
jgi:hypothetical protein